MNMKTFFKISSAIVLVAMLSVGCKKEKEVAVVEVDEPKPTAGFTVEVPDTIEYKGFQFKSLSTNYKEILWQFGDDSTSTEESPYHKYVFDGDYRVNLTVRNSQGYTASREVILKVNDPNFDPRKIGPNYFKTVGGKLTVSRDNQGGPESGEGSLKLIDENSDTKFLQSGFAGDLVIKFELDSAVIAGAYSLTSANDADDRDPKVWTVQGSEDGIKWITLASATASDDPNSSGYKYKFTARRQRKFWHFNNNVAFKFYRINIKSNFGSRDFQMAEWSMNQKQPDK
ncbi:PKD domain-containing protein [Mucilaginibacter sp. UR6-1]|uniref:PKD domain-containing protein n=1 Tax=Mucilaginibacter sp. UR6-1 TaxID=1435643 RepID=UPI001E2BE0D5|nr:PKD domain-containing protein [Mucilaginibacter sp. UR6-1]MCC8408087.1 PKD domain-containing protein [Mucilaginibacter sp. UR6-1]